MPTPHKHAALIKQWADDPSLTVWCWDGYQWLMALEGKHPRWIESVPYAIGPKPTQPPRKMCVLAGVEFPAPESVAPAPGTTYYIPGTVGVGAYSWYETMAFDQSCLAHGLVHLTREAAEQHSRALLAANKQAIEGAR